MSLEEQNFLYMVDGLCGAEEGATTVEHIDRMSPEDVGSILTVIASMQESMERNGNAENGASPGGCRTPARGVRENATCAHCGEVEPMMGDFKRCSRCKKIHYCSSACQKAHWKTHKPTCGSAAAAEPEAQRQGKENNSGGKKKGTGKKKGSR